MSDPISVDETVSVYRIGDIDMSHDGVISEITFGGRGIQLDIILRDEPLAAFLSEVAAQPAGEPIRRRLKLTLEEVPDDA